VTRAISRVPTSSDRVLQRKCGCAGSSKSPGSCDSCRRKELQRKATGPISSEVPPIVHDVLRSPGQPLDASTRAFMEPRFGHDFSKVRVHTDERAAESAEAVNALAYTVGTHIVFAPSQYHPILPFGQYLLAHELTHVAQQGNYNDIAMPSSVDGMDSPAELEAEKTATSIMVGTSCASPQAKSGNVLSRFSKSEKNQIGGLNDIITQTRKIAVTSQGHRNTVNFATFVTEHGGRTAEDAIAKRIKPDSVQAQRFPSLRYLMSCRCGLIDLTHFHQHMYMASFYTNTTVGNPNRQATEKGREHELSSEPGSRFAAEDAPSNALGSLFGSSMRSHHVTPEELIDDLFGFLKACHPIDFSSIPASEQEAIVDYYAQRNPDGTPTNSNETAIPAILPISACNRSREFPFEVDRDDKDRKTLSQKTKPFRLSGDSEIRSWLDAANVAEIKLLPTWEKTRLVNRLLDGWVSDSDMTAIETICSNVFDSFELSSISGSVSSRIDSLYNKSHQERLMMALNRRTP